MLGGVFQPFLDSSSAEPPPVPNLSAGYLPGCSLAPYCYWVYAKDFS